MPSFLPDSNPSHIVRCSSCAKETTASEVGVIWDASEKLFAGGVVPAGQCTDCGELAYLIPDVTNLQTAYQAAIVECGQGEFAVIRVGDEEIYFMVEASYLAQDVGPVFNPYTGERLSGKDVDPDTEAREAFAGEDG